MTKLQQLNQKAQKLSVAIPAERGIKQVIVSRGWYRPEVHSNARFGYYVNVNYGPEAANYSLGRTAKDAEQALNEWQNAEIEFAS